jgi:hypothetical protein
LDAWQHGRAARHQDFIGVRFRDFVCASQGENFIECALEHRSEAARFQQGTYILALAFKAGGRSTSGAAASRPIIASSVLVVPRSRDHNRG